MTPLLLAGLLLAAFEFETPVGRRSAMLASVAVSDPGGALAVNPALVVTVHRVEAMVGHSRPHGLANVDAVSGGALLRPGGWASGLALVTVGFERYRESDIRICAGAELPLGLAVGGTAHVLIANPGGDAIEAAPALDLGVHWRSGILALGACAGRLNQPRFANGDVVPVRFAAGLAIAPFEDLLLALDVVRERGTEDVRLGAEFRLIPQLGLRAGVGLVPISYASGLGVDLVPFGLDYAYRFHPQLEETHVIGIRVAWR